MSRYYNEELDAWGEPQLYNGIKLYPINIYDRSYIELAFDVFGYCKTQSKERDILKGSYLRMLLMYMSDPNDYSPNSLIYKIQTILSFITKEDVSIGVDSLEEDISFYIQIGDIRLAEYDFDNIRDIVLLQLTTSSKYIEEYQPDLEESLKFLNRGGTPTTMAEDIFILSIAMQFPISEIRKLTYYQFNKYMERVRAKIDHDLYKPLLISGQIEFKKGVNIKSWNEHIPKKSRYSDIMADVDSFKSETDLAFSNK